MLTSTLDLDPGSPNSTWPVWPISPFAIAQTKASIWDAVRLLAITTPDEQTSATDSVSVTEELTLLRNGNQDAWDRLVTTASPKLFSYLRQNLFTAEDAEDVLNESFLAAVKSIKSFAGGSSVMTWLYSIARHKMLDFRRRGRETVELSESLDAPVENVSIEFREALHALPVATRQALLLRYFDGFSVAEVATILGKTYRATESLLSRGRVALSQQLEK